jgi:hypothetical protein
LTFKKITEYPLTDLPTPHDDRVRKEWEKLFASLDLKTSLRFYLETEIRRQAHEEAEERYLK